MLQWGRVSEDAETSRSSCTRSPHPQLQWGRVSEDAETMADMMLARIVDGASMGPRLGRRGNGTG